MYTASTSGHIQVRHVALLTRTDFGAKRVMLPCTMSRQRQQVMDIQMSSECSRRAMMSLNTAAGRCSHRTLPSTFVSYWLVDSPVSGIMHQFTLLPIFAQSSHSYLSAFHTGNAVHMTSTAGWGCFKPRACGVRCIDTINNNNVLQPKQSINLMTATIGCSYCLTS